MSYDTNDPAIVNQAGRDAAALVEARMAGDDDAAGRALDECVPSLVADQLAIFLAKLFSADEATRQRVARDPARILAGWRESFGEPPAERVRLSPAEHLAFPGDMPRDAAALVEVLDRGDLAAADPIFASANPYGLALFLAREYAALARQFPGGLAARVATFRAGAETMDGDGG